MSEHGVRIALFAICIFDLSTFSNYKGIFNTMRGEKHLGFHFLKCLFLSEALLFLIIPSPKHTQGLYIYGEFHIYTEGKAASLL